MGGGNCSRRLPAPPGLEADRSVPRTQNPPFDAADALLLSVAPLSVLLPVPGLVETGAVVFFSRARTASAPPPRPLFSPLPCHFTLRILPAKRLPSVPPLEKPNRRLSALANCSLLHRSLPSHLFKNTAPPRLPRGEPPTPFCRVFNEQGGRE